MAIVSFSLTKDEFLAGIKTVTRRDWSDRHLDRWQAFWDSDKLVHDAWDKIPIAGGTPIGKFRLTARPYRERLKDMPLDDLLNEGGMCSSIEEFCSFVGKTPEDYVAVIRFEKL